MQTAFFDSIAAGFDTPALRFHAFAADQIVQALEPLNGQKLLDIGTGTGHVAIAAAQAVKPDGRVHALDQSSRMLDQCFTKLQHLDVQGVDLHEMDAMRPEFRRGYFDVVVSAFSLPFMPDMNAAFTAWKDCLRPGGKLVLSYLSAQAWQPMLEGFYRILQDYEGLSDIAQNNMAQHFLVPENIEKNLLQSGFAHCQTQTQTWGYYLQPADWIDALLHSHHRMALDALSEKQQAEVLEKHLQQLDVPAQGLYLNTETHFTAAYTKA